MYASSVITKLSMPRYQFHPQTAPPTMTRKSGMTSLKFRYSGMASIGSSSGSRMRRMLPSHRIYRILRRKGAALPPGRSPLGSVGSVLRFSRYSFVILGINRFAGTAVQAVQEQFNEQHDFLCSPLYSEGCTSAGIRAGAFAREVLRAPVRLLAAFSDDSSSIRPTFCRRG